MSLAHDGQGTSPPRVLILSGFWPPHEGGVERYAQAMADELAARGWQVHAAFSAVIGTQVGALHHDAPDTGEMEPPHEPDTEPARVPSGAALHRYPVTMLARRLPVPDVWTSTWRGVRRTLARTPFDLVIVMSHPALSR